jgi:hypothetical protein
MCCGRRKRISIVVQPAPVAPRLPTHRTLKTGVAAIYVGAESRRVVGPCTKFPYFLSPHARHLLIDERDIDVLVRHEDIVMKP